MVANCDSRRTTRKLLKFLSLRRISSPPFQGEGWCAGIVFSLIHRFACQTQEEHGESHPDDGQGKANGKIERVADLYQDVPCCNGCHADEHIGQAACAPKKVPRQSDGMILAIMLCQPLAVKPAPSPCQMRIDEG